MQKMKKDLHLRASNRDVYNETIPSDRRVSGKTHEMHNDIFNLKIAAAIDAIRAYDAIEALKTKTTPFTLDDSQLNQMRKMKATANSGPLKIEHEQRKELLLPASVSIWQIRTAWESLLSLREKYTVGMPRNAPSSEIERVNII